MTRNYLKANWFSLNSLCCRMMCHALGVQDLATDCERAACQEHPACIASTGIINSKLLKSDL